MMVVCICAVFLSAGMSLSTCGEQKPKKPKESTPDTTYSYNFASPDLELKLPGRLKEISGLTLVDDSLLAAVQDEKGEVYLIDNRSGKVVDSFRFAKNGDFEGIEIVDDTLYVLRADGDVFMIVDWRSEDRSTSKIETYLATKNDTEGLGYQPEQHRLLVAAKEFPGRGRERVRSIYGFDMRTKTLDPEPVYMVPLDMIGASLNLPGERLRSVLSSLVDLESFKPSAVAVHPRTKDVFILSSVLKVIGVLNSSGELVNLLPLELRKLKQPEGLAFLPNGDLFISTEGDGGKGKIFRFNENHVSE